MLRVIRIIEYIIILFWNISRPNSQSCANTACLCAEIHATRCSQTWETQSKSPYPTELLHISVTITSLVSCVTIRPLCYQTPELFPKTQICSLTSFGFYFIKYESKNVPAHLWKPPCCT